MSIPSGAVRYLSKENKMQYLLLIYLDENIQSDTERQACYVESTELAHDLHREGRFIATAPLHPTTTATTVKVRDGKPIVTDGPFAETREQLGGYFLVNAENLDEAIRIAKRIPGARLGSVEIRPVLELEGLP